MSAQPNTSSSSVPSTESSTVSSIVPSTESSIESPIVSLPISAKTDFYQYVNEKWLADPANAIPSDYTKWGSFLTLYDQSLKDQIELIKSLYAKENKTDEEKKILIIWEASDKRFKSWKDNTASLLPISRELEILDSYLVPNKPISSPEDLVNRIADYLYYTQINGISNILDFDKGSDLVCANNYVLDISTTGCLSLPSRDYYITDRFTDKLELFKQHLTNIASLVNASSTTILDSDFVQHVLDFESELALNKMTDEQTRQYDVYYTGTTLTDCYKKINELNSVPEKQLNFPEDKRNFVLSESQIELAGIFFERLYDLFKFRQILKDNRQKSFIDKDIPNPPSEEHISVYDGDSIRRILAMVMTPDNFMKYRAYLQYKIICAYSGYCTKEMDDEYFDFYNRKLIGQMVKKPEDKQSINLVNAFAGEMMGKVYVAKFFPEEYKRDIKLMVNEILDVMQSSLKRNDWLTESTKAKALEKLSKFTIKIGYPDVWKDYSDMELADSDTLYDVFKKTRKWKLRHEFFDKLNTVLDRNEWGMSPQTVNAYYSHPTNEIVFPAAILQPPFYCKTLDQIDFDHSEESDNHTLQLFKQDVIRAANLGGIGAVIAHEITHGFDDQGRKFDADGNMKDWWTPEDADLFIKKTELMKQQVETYQYVDPDDGKVHQMNAPLTMGENLADLGGLSLSLQALNNHLDTTVKPIICESEYKQIHKLMNCILFKSFSNIWKQNIKKDLRIQYLTLDPHAPTEFRANLVKNMQEFYEAFNVSETDPMYISPEKRLRMW